MRRRKLLVEKQEEEQLIEEFDLINPFAEEIPPGGAIDKDFEPKDPGWEYPDTNREPKYIITPPPPPDNT